MNRKKMNIMLILMVAIAMLVTACGGKTGNNGTNNGSNTPATTNNGTNTPADQEPVTLTFVNKDFPLDDPNTAKLITKIEEGMKAQGTPVKIEVVPVQSGTYSEKLGLLLQSGTIPDLIYFQGGDYQFAITQGILEDLTPYIEKSTHLKASLSEYNIERMKEYPYLVYAAPTTTSVSVVRKDWFDQTASGKTLLENPTIDNYVTFFKELKEVSGAKYVYTTAGTLDEIDPLFAQAFGMTSTWVKDDSGSYVYGAVSKYGKDKLDFYAKLYQEGLLDPEYLTKKWDTKEQAFYDGDAAVIAGRQGKVINIYNTKMMEQNGVEVMPLVPAKGVGQGFVPINVSKEDRGFAISKLSKNKDAAFALLEYMASPEGLMLDQLGVEGDEYTITDNQITLTDKFPAWYAHFIDNTMNFKPEQTFNPETPFLSPAALESLELVQTYSTKDNAFVIPADQSAAWDAAIAIYKEYAANVVTGKASINDFDKMVVSFNAAGGKAMTEYANQTIK